MCLAIPAEIIDLLDDERARVSVGGARKVVSVSLIENPAIGEFVLVHVGHALSKIDADEAHKTLHCFAEIFGAENLLENLPENLPENPRGGSEGGGS